jgi:ankyrin repeat protein
VLSGKVELVEFFDLGLKHSTENKFGWTLLHFAASQGNGAVVSTVIHRLQGETDDFVNLPGLDG